MGLKTETQQPLHIASPLSVCSRYPVAPQLRSEPADVRLRVTQKIASRAADMDTREEADTHIPLRPPAGSSVTP